MTSAETLRAREVYRYYQPRNLRESPDLDRIPPPKPGQQPSRSTFSNLTNFNTQQSFSDTALTAFTQLIALRLESQRAIVSLSDHENEYFLAESTSSFSLIGDAGPEQNAWLSISGARVPRGASLCEETLRLVPNSDTTAEMTSVFLVPDLRLNKKMCQLECVKGAPFLRFYCGVALTNNMGINIGCVYVVDDRPRTHVSPEQSQFLTRMAATVMDHLENIRAKEDIVRVTRMSQALHAFIEGDGTMDGDWQRLKKYNLPSGAAGGDFHWESNKIENIEPVIDGKKQGSVLVRNLTTTTNTEFSMSPGQSPLQYTESSPNPQFMYNRSPWSSTSEVPQLPALKSVFEVVEDAATKVTESKDNEFSNNGFFSLLHTTFSRASNLVREGMEVDGAVFFDAPLRFYQGRSTLETDTRLSDAKEAGSLSDSDDEDDVRPGPSPRILPSYQQHSSREGTPTRLEHGGVPERDISMGLKSDVLGFSTNDSSSWNNQDINFGTKFSPISQSLLTSLVRRYPQGEMFVFDEHGPISVSDLLLEEGSGKTLTPILEAKRARHKARKRAEILRLLDSFPRARQILFVPLYDSTSGCFIGSFAWSTSATRIFSVENHLSYLVAFGHSVMSEVSRLNTLSADRAKGEFINNVSHELRSPLHGVLASVEFLADTTLDGFQRNLVDTVDLCGRTLLDTIEHVLDFSKIKKFGAETLQPMGDVTDLDVSAFIEGVLEGVFAGFEFNGLSSQGLADPTTSRARDSFTLQENIGIVSLEDIKPTVPNNPVTVIVDMDFRDQWKFPVVPGTWRRLTMNIFGNALKFTRSGFVSVKLEARSISPMDSNVKNDGIKRTLVTLTISDSGQGMSPKFLESKLFIPFTQEDPTCPGTGLGMSIVKQIVDLAGGRIEVQSEKGKGTTVRISLPLEDCLREPQIIIGKLDGVYTREDAINTARRRAHGRTIHIRGFDPAPGISDLQAEALAQMKNSIEKYAIEWFKLTIVSDGDVADLVICDESTFSDFSRATIKFHSLLILCSNGVRRDIYNTPLEPGQTVEFVGKPCGPHRLAKALLNCFDSEDAIKLATKQRSPAGFPPTSSEPLRISLPQTNMQPTAFRRPSFSKRRMSGLILRPKSNETSSSESLSFKTSEFSEDSSSSSLPPIPSTSHLVEDPFASPPITEEDESMAEVRPKMLLVEDNPVNMMLLATYMKKNNWDFEMASNGLIALQTFQSSIEGFDVIFMDVSMPVMTGYESTRLIRAIETERRLAYELQQSRYSPNFSSPPSPSFPFSIPRSVSNANSPSSFSPSDLEARLAAQDTKLGSHIPALIIALTGFSSKEDQEMAFEAGVDVFMTKPVRFKEVSRILNEWMVKRNAADSEAFSA